MKTLLTIVFATLICTATIAQRNADPTEKIERKVEMLDKHLELTDKQEDQLEEVFLKYFKKKGELKEAAQEDRKQKMKEINDAQKEEISKILTPAQFEKYKEIEKKMMERSKQGGKKGNRGGRQ